MRSFIKTVVLFLVGGSIYITIEYVYRLITSKQPTHWTMFVLGGLVFLIVGEINERIDWDVPFFIQILIGTLYTVELEFIFGYVLNIHMGLNIWDYSDIPFNILGQVCLPFAFLWAILVSFSIVMDDYIRYVFFGEEKPYYNLF